MEQQKLKVRLSSIFMWIITLPNKIKQQALMLHLDGWAQQHDTQSTPYFLVFETYVGGR
jgi:hypothetical protein